MTEEEKNSWNIATIKEYTDRRFEESDRAVSAALVAQEKFYSATLTANKEAVVKAENATEKRFESVNEFRAQLSDQSSSFMPRVEYDARTAALLDRITKLEMASDFTQGVEKGSSITMAKIYAAIGGSATLVGLVVLLINSIVAR